ncbi:hypothetical protein AB1Y20_007705 [Prymnesium parvum]|uniref:Uncharacterized protein n=1 Tax=Prymnesium parvum TaxID=97485 RepID=A0AB34IYS5_PRYPA
MESVLAAAEGRTIRRVAWCAWLEALLDPSQQLSTLDELLTSVGLAIQAQTADEWRDDGWASLVKEVQQSLHFEMIACEWRLSKWCPRVRANADAAGCTSLWAWSWTLPSDSSRFISEEHQLTWEVAASFDGDMVHPCAKSKLDITPQALIRMSPEFEPVVPLPVAAISTRIVKQYHKPSVSSASAYFAEKFPACYSLWVTWLMSIGEVPEQYVPIPVHPANLRPLTSDLSLLLDGGLLLLPGSEAGAMLAQPLVSFSTLLPLRGGGDGGASARGIAPPYIKLPVHVKLPVFHHNLTPIEAQGAVLLSSVVKEAARREAAAHEGSGVMGSLHILGEECAVHLAAPGLSYEQGRHLSAIYGANLGNLELELHSVQPLPLAALFSTDPLTSRPVLVDVLAAAAAADDPVEAARWFEQHCNVVVSTLLPLWLHYGIALEMQPQNCVLLLRRDGQLHGLVCREVGGGVRCWENLLVANGFDIRGDLHPRQAAVFADPQAPLDSFFHATFVSHLLPLSDALSACVPGVFGGALLESMRRAISSCLRRSKATLDARTLPAELRAPYEHAAALTEHCWLRARTVRVKSLLVMGALGTSTERFAEASNPLLRREAETSTARARAARVAQGKGRFTPFPIPSVTFC